jgi:spermidine synthase
MPLVYLEKEDIADKVYEIQPGSYKYLKTRVQEIEIFTHLTWGRMIFINGVLQSTSFDESLYHTALTSTLPFSGKVCVLGGGEGATVRELLKYMNIERIDMVDWDEAFVKHMAEYEGEWSQGAYTNPKVNVCFKDVFQWIRENTQVYDYIVVDLFDPEEFTEEEWVKLLSAIKLYVKRGVVLNGGRMPLNDKEKVEFERAVHSVFFSNVAPSAVDEPNALPQSGGAKGWHSTISMEGKWSLKWTNAFVPSFCSEWMFATIKKKE